MGTSVSDAKIRDLERAARSGGDAEKATYLSAMERAGRVSLRNLEAAALVGHRPSRLLFTGADWTRQSPSEAMYEVLNVVDERSAYLFGVDVLIYEARLLKAQKIDRRLVEHLELVRNNPTQTTARLLFDFCVLRDNGDRTEDQDRLVSVYLTCQAAFRWLLQEGARFPERRVGLEVFRDTTNRYWDIATTLTPEEQARVLEEISEGRFGDRFEDTERAPQKYRRLVEPVIAVLFPIILPEAGV
jgi:hypothetical protein